MLLPDTETFHLLCCSQILTHSTCYVAPRYWHIPLVMLLPDTDTFHILYCVSINELHNVTVTFAQRFTCVCRCNNLFARKQDNCIVMNLSDKFKIFSIVVWLVTLFRYFLICVNIRYWCQTDISQQILVNISCTKLSSNLTKLYKIWVRLYFRNSSTRSAEPNSMELVTIQRHCVQIFYTKCHLNRSVNIEAAVISSLTPVNTTLLPLHLFSQKLAPSHWL